MNKPGNSPLTVADGQSSDLFSGKASSADTHKAAASSKGKVRVGAAAERGEATGLGGIGAPGVMGGAKPGGMPGKGSLAMAGGNILDDARPQKSTLLKKNADAATGNPQNATAQNQAQNSKYIYDLHRVQFTIFFMPLGSIVDSSFEFREKPFHVEAADSGSELPSKRACQRRTRSW